ncbi:hypothetical protein Q7M_1225 (plasmid) [Borrelia crocidurae str. Achema]|uniref:Uncharacterized protein n=1 Tax=Borrelia crocidurae (strain Achema) TaxID=1155096 RepID=I0FES6_BORCA|nr:hypothetical protein Q7M_1225 [Borrelia crocidurae str. Achema]
MPIFEEKGISIRENIFLYGEGSFSLDVKKVAKSRLEYLLPYKLIEKMNSKMGIIWLVMNLGQRKKLHVKCTNLRQLFLYHKLL